MYEVVLTFRPDFHELIYGRYITEDQARGAAAGIMDQQRADVIRVWVRHIRPAKAKS